MRGRTNPQAILEKCFERGIVLRRFDHTEPTLHDAFVALVGSSPADVGLVDSSPADITLVDSSPAEESV